MADINVSKMDEDSLVLCAEFLAWGRGVSIGSPSVAPEYLRWKYLSAEAAENVCLFLESDGIICAIVGGMVWNYNINGVLVKVCFPADWYSSIKSPVKGAGRKVMRALMDMFPASVAVGGSKMCFQPQIAVGFRDIGEVLLLGIDGRMITGLREVARRARDFILHPLYSWKGRTLARRFDSWTDVVFTKEELVNEMLLRFQGVQLFSCDVPRQDLLRKWQHYLNQPSNFVDIISVQFRGKVSYFLVGELCKGSLALADALIDPEHNIEDILSAFTLYAYSKSRSQALFMTSNLDILSIAISLGYQVRDRFRTQYFARSDGPLCEDMRSCPSVSFVSADEMVYRHLLNKQKGCSCKG